MHEIQRTDPEPPAGSVLMLHGETGTAVQRFYNDGLYHTTTGKVLTFAQLFTTNTNRLPLLILEGNED